MFSNIGGLEVVFVMIVALIVLGPAKLPEAARQAGKFVNQVRQISNGFQREFREAIQDPIKEVDTNARKAITDTKIAVTEPFSSAKADLTEATRGSTPKPKPDGAEPEKQTSTDEAPSETTAENPTADVTDDD